MLLNLEGSTLMDDLEYIPATKKNIFNKNFGISFGYGILMRKNCSSFNIYC
jgi:hypothetical protein